MPSKWGVKKSAEERFFEFELGTSSSGPSRCDSGPNSITFGTVPKSFDWPTNFSKKTEERSAWSSRSLSSCGSKSSIDWTNIAESVFKEEIVKFVLKKDTFC